MERNTIDSIKIGLASPETMLSWSYGEVKKPETINYRTLKAERDGLYCERIFGPTKDWECLCGKYKRIRHKNKVCEKCGVEVTQKKVRRERMGHIQLAAPVSHIWYFRAIPSRMGLLLDISPRHLEKVLYFASYIVIDPGSTPLAKYQLLSEKEYREYYTAYENDFKVGMGAEAVKELLAELDIEALSEQLKAELENGTGVDVAIDCLGGEIMGKCIHHLKHGARWIMIAALAGQKTEIDLKNIYVRNVRIVGSTLRSRTPEMKAFILSELVKNVFPKIATGEVKPTIYKTLPITEAEAAHDILYKGENVGKVVLTLN